MRVLLATLLLLTLSVPLQSKEVLQKSFESVAYLRVGEKGNHCTTWTPRIKQWISAAHCLDGNAPLFINGVEVEIIKQDNDLDLVLLTGPIATPLALSDREPLLGEAVVMIGWPGAHTERFPMVFFGRTNGVGYRKDPQLRHELNSFHEGGGEGMSGGPIVNLDGKVVGMVEAYLRFPSMVMFSQTVKDIRKFIR